MIAGELGLTHQRIQQILKRYPVGKIPVDWCHTQYSRIPVRVAIKTPRPLANIDRIHVRGMTGRDRTRELVRVRDDHTCQACGRKWQQGERRLDVHHLKGLCGRKSLGYDKISETDILITLCHKCHYNHHDHTLVRRKISMGRTAT